MTPLTLLPENGLDQGLHAPILVGLVISVVFAETLGWTLAGLVVPGYLAAVFAVAHVTGITVIVEAALTFGLASVLGDWMGKTRAWSAFFGRERFFLLVVASLLVRIVMDGAVLPLLATRFALPYSFELYSIGLVLVPLLANAWWSTGLLRGSFQLAVTTGLTFLVLDVLLLPYTNLTLSDFQLTYESVAVSFQDLPKPYLVLIVGAALAARANVLYGWDFGGILVPALLALAWYEPTHLLTTLVEAVLIYAIATAMVRLPPFSRLLMEGTRRLLLCFVIGFVLKIAAGFIALRHAPGFSADAVGGFGYLLSSLLAVKMWRIGNPFHVLLPTLQVSLVAFLAGNAVGFGLQLVSRAAAGETSTLIASPLRSEPTLARALLLASALPDEPTSAVRDDPIGGGLLGWAELYEDAVAAMREGSVSASLRGRAATVGARFESIPAADGRPEWVLVRPDAELSSERLPGATLAIGSGERQPWLIDVRTTDPALWVVAAGVAQKLNARALLTSTLSPRDAARLRHAIAARAEVDNILVVEAADHEGPPRLSVTGHFPIGLRPSELESVLHGPADLQWVGSSDDDRVAARLAIPTGAARSIAAFALGAPPLLSWEESSASRAVRSRLRELTTVGASGYVAPTPDELRAFGRHVYPAVRSAIDRPADPDAWSRAAAGALGYRFARTGDGALFLFEPPGPDRRGNATIVVRRPHIAAEPVLEIPSPRFERGTVAIGIALAAGLGSATWLIAGAMPYAGEGTRAATVRIDARVSYYQRMHELLLGDGHRAVSVRGMPSDRVPTDVDIVLSTGDEAPRVEARPAWSSRIAALFEAQGVTPAWFDGSEPFRPFSGAEDPAVAYARRFHEHAMVQVWTSPRMRQRYDSPVLSADRADTALPPLQTGDVVEETIGLAASADPERPCPFDDLARLARHYAGTRNPYAFAGLSARAGTDCRVALVEDLASGSTYVVLATRDVAWLVRVDLPSRTGSSGAPRPIQSAEEARTRVMVGAAELHWEAPR